MLKFNKEKGKEIKRLDEKKHQRPKHFLASERKYLLYRAAARVVF
jgi:hypothetical protein